MMERERPKRPKDTRAKKQGSGQEKTGDWEQLSLFPPQSWFTATYDLRFEFPFTGEQVTVTTPLD